MAHLKVSWLLYGGEYIPGKQGLLYDLTEVIREDIAFEDQCWILSKVCLRCTLRER